jgi:pantoate--beta-alanine ligase
MRTVRTIAAVREHVGAARAGGRTIALVPTMGAFHAGHEALIAAARAAAGDDGLVVVSLFVNPAQFNQAADLAAYPRSEADDAARATELGVDLLFAPAVEEIYPDGFTTTVTVAGLSDVLEGAQRPGHFAGVTTVVTKLLNIVAPDVVLFGQKDAQQVVVVRRLVRDLDLPVRLEVISTVREPDGLALSSRNRLLDPADRAAALSLSRGLRAAREALEAGERDAARLGDAVRAAMDGVEPEYVAVVDPDTLAPLDTATERMLVAVAARVGPVRLIDNLLIDHRQTQVATSSGAPTTTKE